MALILPPDVAALNVAASILYQTAFAAITPWYQQVATQVNISTTSARFPFTPEQDIMRQWIGARVVRDVEVQNYNLRPNKFEKTVSISRDDYLDQQFAGLQMSMSSIGSAAAKWPDQRVIAAIQANGNSFDGLPFFSANHPLDPGGVQSNTGALALTAANYATTREFMMSLTGQDGQPLGIVPNVLLHPPQLDRQAKEILNADIIADPGGIAAGVTNVNKGSAVPLMIPELGAVSATGWYLLDTSKAIKPFVFVMRETPLFVSKQAPDDETVFWDDEFVWGTSSRGEAGYGLWFQAFRGNV